MIMTPKEGQARDALKNLKIVNYNSGIYNHLGELEYEKKYVFKVLNKKEELLQMFALRYLVYRYVHFIESNKDQLDIDCYDLFSTFLGAFEVIGKTKRLVGTIRIISGDAESPHLKMIKSILGKLVDFNGRNILSRPTPYPLMETFKVPEEYLKTLNDKNNKFDLTSSKPYELSRLAILPEYWGARAKIEKGIHELIILDAWKSNPHKNIYFIATHPRTKQKYKKLGFNIITGTKESLYKSIKQLAIAMTVNLENFLSNPNPYKDYCKDMYDHYLKVGFLEKK